MGMKAQLRYRFDNVMARGPAAQIALLAVVTMALVVIAVVATLLFGVEPDGDGSFGRLVWLSLMHSLDAGTLAGDDWDWGYLAIMLVVTIGGIFVLSGLIGVLTQAFGDRLEALRRGASPVVERGHVVVLGWDPKIFTLLGELAEANRNQRDACVVILADRDKVEMDAEIGAALSALREQDGRKLRVVTRSGSTMSMEALGLVALERSKAVIVLSPEYRADGSRMAANEADTRVLKTLLALSKVDPGKQLNIVAELLDPRSESVARMVVGPNAALVLAGPLISRLLVQTGRQPGLSVVYSELLDFAGVEIYVTPQPELEGRTFAEAAGGYDTSSLIGVRTSSGEILVPPAFDRVFGPGDQVIAISEDDDRIVLNGRPVTDTGAIVPAPPAQPPVPERTLILGFSPRLPVVLRELDAYVAPGSETVVVGDGDPATVLENADNRLVNMKLTAHASDITDRNVLDRLDITGFTNVLVLSETDGRTQEMADARTTVALLHLRDIERTSRGIPTTSEILEIQSRNLATVAEPDDFIVSNMLVSLMVSQVAENPHLIAVFEELFTAEGYELYLRPATDYVLAGSRPFGVVCEAALRRQEIAVGYRLGENSRDAERAFGVVVNPPKSLPVALGPDDKIIVLANS